MEDFIMIELKPFHESVFDNLKDNLLKFDSYRRPSGALSSQSVSLLMRDLEQTIKLIENTFIPVEKLDWFIVEITIFFESVIEKIDSKGYDERHFSEINEKEKDLLKNLKQRLN